MTITYSPLKFQAGARNFSLPNPKRASFAFFLAFIEYMNFKDVEDMASDFCQNAEDLIEMGVLTEEIAKKMQTIWLDEGTVYIFGQ